MLGCSGQMIEKTAEEKRLEVLLGLGHHHHHQLGICLLFFSPDRNFNL